MAQRLLPLLAFSASALDGGSGAPGPASLNTPEEPCVYSLMGGPTYNFTLAAGRAINGTDIEMENYGYSVAVCGNVTWTCYDIQTGETTFGNVYYESHQGPYGTCWEVQGRWDESTLEVQEHNVDFIANQTASYANEEVEGITLVSRNGDPCRVNDTFSKPMTVYLNLFCYDTADELRKGIWGPVVGRQSNEGMCETYIDAQTPLACGGGQPATDGAEDGGNSGILTTTTDGGSSSASTAASDGGGGNGKSSNSDAGSIVLTIFSIVLAFGVVVALLVICVMLYKYKTNESLESETGYGNDQLISYQTGDQL